MFPTTRRSAVAAIGDDDPVARARAFDILVRAYWKPVYKHVRVKWNRAEAEAQDLTQSFFAAAFEKDYLARYVPARALFRTFLKTCLDRHVMEAARNDQRHKRGGHGVRLSLDFDAAEGELRTVGVTEGPDACFDREWTRAIFSRAVETLRDACERGAKQVRFAIFSRCVLHDDDAKPSYAELATEFDISVSDVNNHLAWARREFRSIVVNEIREITSTEEEFRSEVRTLLGIDPP